MDVPLTPGLEPGEGGHAIGRDPRTMSRAELAALGHEPMTVLRALRAHCLDCCGGSAQEVRLCTATRCPSWPYRLGRSPWRAPRSEAQRKASHAALKKARASGIRQRGGGIPAEDAEDAPSTPRPGARG